jgi:hypothetical protein
MRKLVLSLGALLGVLMLLVAHDVLAQGASTNFRIDESFVGPGGQLESNSTNYKTAPGGQAVGNGAAGGAGGNESSSTNYGAKAGSQTTDDPSLTCSVSSSSISFGALSTGATATGTATFNVLNYTAYGYIVQIIGNTPNSGAHNLTAMSSNAASATGTEQFGINLVANTSPATFGANPVQVPSGSFSYGAAATNYNTANSYRYVSGETIASATKTSGETDYTISYIVNVATTTAGGSYSGNQSLVCIGTY